MIDPNLEAERLQKLYDYKILDTPPESGFDEITQIASGICDVPVSLISLVDQDRQWFKSRLGIEEQQTHRNIAFCHHAIQQQTILEVPDARLDERFKDNPMVTREEKPVRYYAGIPLKTNDGYALGTLCVIDFYPRELTEPQKRALQSLARQVVMLMESRLENIRLSNTLKAQEQLFALVSHDLRAGFNNILNFSRLLAKRPDDISDEKLDSMVQAILRSSVQAWQLLEELLQWSLQRYKMVSLDISVFSLKELVDETLEFLEPLISAKALSVNNMLGDSIMVEGDKLLSKTIIRNLLSNAIKFSQKGGVIDISVEKAGDYTSLSITDYGVGIADEVAANLFNDHIKSTSGTEGEKGLGIGLLLAYEAAKIQGAKLSFDNSVDQGARFLLDLKKPLLEKPSA